MKGEMQTSAQGDSNGTPRPQADHGMIRKLTSYRFALSLPCIVFILEFQRSLESHTFCFKSLIPDSCSVLSGTHQWYLCLSLSLFCIRLDFFSPLAGSRRVQGDLNGTPGPLEGHGKRRPSMQTSNDYDRSLGRGGRRVSSSIDLKDEASAGAPRRDRESNRGPCQLRLSRSRGTAAVVPPAPSSLPIAD